MKIMIVNNLYRPNIMGGAEKSVQNLAEGLVSQGHDVVVATLNVTGRYDYSEIGGVRIHYLPMRNIYSPTCKVRRSKSLRALWHAVDSYNPFIIRSLARVIDRERPEIVSTHNLSGFSASVWRLVKKRRLPLVHTIRDHYILCPRSTMHHDGHNCATPCGVCRMYVLPRKRLSDLVDGVTSVSHYILNKHEETGCFSHASKAVVFNACEPIPNLPKPGRLPKAPLRFGYLGRLHPTKGPDLLIRSFLEIPKGLARLAIAGEGEPSYERLLKELTKGRSDVQWLRFVPPTTLLGRVDVLVVPSVCNDSAPRTILDAMAHGIPIIASRRGGIPELMGEGTGWLFEPSMPGALMHALRHAIEANEELRMMSTRAAERAEKFSVDAMINGYLEMFRQSAASARGVPLHYRPASALDPLQL